LLKGTRSTIPFEENEYQGYTYRGQIKIKNKKACKSPYRYWRMCKNRVYLGDVCSSVKSR
jgi:hypothetical protein